MQYLELVPELGKLSKQLLGAWEDLQQALLEEDFLILPIESQDNNKPIWQTHIDEVKYEALLKKHNRPALATIFHPSYSSTIKDWTSFNGTLPIRGMFIPIAAIRQFPIHELRQYLLLLKDRSQQTLWHDLLRKVKSDQSDKQYQDTALFYLFAWHHFKHYTLFLSKQTTYNRKLLRQRFPTGKFSEYLPGKQVIYLLHLLAIHFFGKLPYESALEAWKEQAHPSVKKFLDEFEDEILLFLNLMLEKQQIKFHFKEQELKKGFLEVCAMDKTMICFQELLDNQSGQIFREKLPEEAFQSIKSLTGGTVTQQFQQLIGKKSILQRLQSVRDKTEKKGLPFFSPTSASWKSPNGPQWFKAELSLILNIVNYETLHIRTEDRTALEKITHQRWLNYIKTLGNELSGPFLLWDFNKGNHFPVMNILRSKKAESLRQAFFADQQQFIQASNDLDQYIEQLHELDSYSSIIRFNENIPDFGFPYLEDKWAIAVEKHTTAIINKNTFDINKMLQYGIIKDQEYPTEKCNIWLKEMLKIEEEVKPYVMFIKKAFQAALPIRHSVSFDPYRHSLDGIEFDQETFMDQFKWQSGEVMRSLRHQIDRGQAEQLNAFALDASGSMGHEKMRNLFKLLYLMVLGLEGRNSHDAFHFFGTYFMETVPISATYTNRTVLFTILKNIANIEKEYVRYGGTGGTNISEGIFKCYDEITNLKKQLLAQKPNANLLCSIFVITDGQPSIGIVDLKNLHDEIEKRRQNGAVAIKGIFIQPDEEEQEDGSFMEPVFGEGNYVATEDFEKAIHELVYLMSRTYVEQRKSLKLEQRRKKYLKHERNKSKKQNK